MRAPPARLLIETLCGPPDALPAKEVRTIIQANRFDHVIGYAIASLAAMNGLSDSHFYSYPETMLTTPTYRASVLILPTFRVYASTFLRSAACQYDQFPGSFGPVSHPALPAIFRVLRQSVQLSRRWSFLVGCWDVLSTNYPARSKTPR